MLGIGKGRDLLDIIVEEGTMAEPEPWLNRNLVPSNPDSEIYDGQTPHIIQE